VDEYEHVTRDTCTSTQSIDVSIRGPSGKGGRPGTEVRYAPSMPNLVEQLGKEPGREAVIADCVELIDTQVKQKGFLIKSAYATIKAIKRKFVPEVVDSLLDDWLGKLQPHFDKWSATKANTLTEFLVARGEDVAEDLLSVTDVRAQKSSHGTAKKMYLKMRDGAKKNVVEAIPDLAKLVQKHLEATSAQPSATAP
jgi:hypothetical protein